MGEFNALDVHSAQIDKISTEILIILVLAKAFGSDYSESYKQIRILGRNLSAQFVRDEAHSPFADREETIKILCSRG